MYISLVHLATGATMIGVMRLWGTAQHGVVGQRWTNMQSVELCCEDERTVHETTT